MSTQTQSKRAEKTKAERRRRKGLGDEARMKLSVPKDKLDPNYQYRWIKGTPQRLTQLTVHDDYDVVKDEEIAEGDRQTGLGVHPERHGGTDEQGKPYPMVLVRKPRKLYEEDEADKQKTVDDREGALKRGQTPSPDGTPGLTGPHAYVPNGGISIKQGE